MIKVYEVSRKYSMLFMHNNRLYEVSRKYSMLFMHNNRYLNTFNWFTYFVAVNSCKKIQGSQLTGSIDISEI